MQRRTRGDSKRKMQAPTNETEFYSVFKIRLPGKRLTTWAARRFAPPCSRNAELQPGRPAISAFPAGSSAFTSAQVMAAMMVAVSPAFRICARLQVAPWNCLCLFFAHITFLQSCFGCVSYAEYFFVSTNSRPRYDHGPCQKALWRSSYALTRFDQKRKSLT